LSETALPEPCSLGGPDPAPDSPRTYGSVLEEAGIDGENAGDPPTKVDIEEAMERVGMGYFQIRILFAAVR
jgi:F420-dependent methylenetetrahydromethanopterin dehydrogenase